MKKVILTAILCLVFFSGCDELRFAPSELQKQNAYLHNRTTQIAAETAKGEFASAKLQGLTDLAHLQSQSYMTYFGLPKELPAADTAEEILAGAGLAIANQALTESAQRPEPFDVADSIFELAIGISAVIGGAYGTKAMRYLKEAKAKSQALKEVIQGNELFKKTNSESVEAFKQAQANQSTETRKLVAEIKV